MQIFRLHENHTKNVRMYPDKYTYNQIRESAQAMLTAVQIEGGEAEYGMTHENHPITQWLRYRDNWMDCYELTKACNQEYKRRYDNGDHGSWETLKDFDNIGVLRPGGTLQPCAFDDEYKLYPEPESMREVVKNYRNYVKEVKAPLDWFKYKYGDVPAFLSGIVKEH